MAAIGTPGVVGVGAGPGAHGRITTAGVRQATTAAMKPADYIRTVERTGVGFATSEYLSPVEAAQERLLSGLRITEGVALAEVAALAIPTARIADLVKQAFDRGLQGT